MRPIRGLFVLPQLELSNRFAVNFIRTVCQPQRSSAGPRRGKLELLRNAAPAASLNRAVDHSQSHVRRDDLDHRDLSPRSFVADGVHHMSRFQCEQSRLLDLDPRVGNVRANRSLRGDWLTECDPRANALAQRFKRALRQPDKPHAMMNASRPQPSLSDFESATFSQQNI